MQSSVLSSALDATTSKHLTKGERRYPCGFPGCKWIFTRSNHVLRHHQRVHPGYSPSANHGGGGGGGSGSGGNSNSGNSSGNSSNLAASISGGNGTNATSSNNSGGGALAASAALTNNNAKDIAIAAVAAAAQAAVSSATESPVHQTLMQLQQQQMLLSIMSAAALPLEQQLLFLSAATAASSPHAASPIAASTCIPSSERKRSVLSLLDHTDRVTGDSHKEPVSKKIASTVKNHPLILTRSVSPLVTSVVLEEDEDDEANPVQTNGAIEADDTLEGTTAIEEADDAEEDEDRSVTPSQTLEPEILLEVDENQEWRPSDEHTVSSSIGMHDDSDETIAIRSVDGSLLSQSLALGSAAVRPRPYICDVPMCDKRYTKHSHLVRHKVETHKLGKQLSNNSNHSNSNSSLNVQSKNSHNNSSSIKHNISASKVVLPMASVIANDTSSSAPVPPPLNLAERPFVCDFPGCRWSFKRQYHLDRHLLTHQESPARGSGCSSGNSSSSSSSNHSLAVARPLVPVSTSVAPSTNVSSGASSGAIKYACNHPGCGIKVQSETSLEAHVYLTHILSNRNRSNRDQMSSSQSLSLLASLAQRRKQQQQQQQKHQHQLQQQQLAAQQLQHEAGLPPEGLVGRSYSPPSTQATLLSPISGHSNGSNSSDGISKRGARMEVEKALFTCDMPGCDKRFGRNCELTRHKLNHVDIWPFSCDYPGCNRKFKRKDVFKNHQRTHVKEPSSSSLLPSCVVIEPDSGEL